METRIIGIISYLSRLATEMTLMPFPGPEENHDPEAPYPNKWLKKRQIIIKRGTCIVSCGDSDDLSVARNPA